MRRVCMGLVLGMVLVSTASGEPQGQRLVEVQVNATGNTAFSLPPEYGQLVSVAVKSEVHHLYFQGADGAVRIVLIGPRGSIQKVRSELQLLTPEVYLIKRGRGNEPLPEPAPSAENKPKR